MSKQIKKLCERTTFQLRPSSSSSSSSALGKIDFQCVKCLVKWHLSNNNRERENVKKCHAETIVFFLFPLFHWTGWWSKIPLKKSHIQLPMYISHGLRKVGIFHSSWRLVLDWLDGLSMGLLGVPTSLNYHLTCWDNTMQVSRRSRAKENETFRPYH